MPKHADPGKGTDTNDDKNNQQDRVSELENALAEEKEARLRALADLQNYKKRTEQERADTTKTAAMNLINEILEIIDDFYRSTEHAGSDEQVKTDGYEMIFEKLKALIIQQGIKELEMEVGDEFKPELMEALSVIKTDDEKMDNRVISIISRGYIIPDSENVLRPAKVILGKFEK